VDDIIPPLIELTPEEWDVVQRLVDDSPPPSTRLVELLRDPDGSAVADSAAFEG
jgi:hypothetical protein